ncbi:MAG: NDP-sugar synthase [archaeon]|nr:NDP-sugar synthase [archaeon]
MVEVKQAVIMVGGKGTRLYPLTENFPKPAMPVLDQPFLKYQIRSFVDAGIKEIFLACGFKSDLLQKEVGDGSDLGVKITYSDEDTPLGTGGSMKQLESKLDPVFVAANGDTYVDIDLREEIEEHISTGAKITIALGQVDNPCAFGIARQTEDGRIIEFKDKPKPEEVFSNLVNIGIYVVDRSVLSEVPENSFFDFSKDLVPIIASKGERVQGYRQKSGTWVDIGTPANLIEMNLLMAERLHSEDTFGLGQDTELVHPAYVGFDSLVKNSKLQRSAVLAGCKIQSSNITESLIMSGCNLQSATVTRSILGKGCVVEDGAVITDCVLREGTVVPKGAVLEKRVG